MGAVNEEKKSVWKERGKRISADLPLNAREPRSLILLVFQTRPSRERRKKRKRGKTNPTQDFVFPL